MKDRFKVFESTSAVELEQKMNRWVSENKGKLRRTQVATAFVPPTPGLGMSSAGAGLGVVLRTVVVNYEPEEGTDVTT